MDRIDKLVELSEFMAGRTDSVSLVPETDSDVIEGFWEFVDFRTKQEKRS